MLPCSLQCSTLVIGIINHNIEYLKYENISVKQIEDRHKLLEQTIGVRRLEIESYENSVHLFNSVLPTFLIFSVLEVVSFLAYEYLVSLQSTRSVLFYFYFSLVSSLEGNRSWIKKAINTTNHLLFKLFSLF